MYAFDAPVIDPKELDGIKTALRPYDVSFAGSLQLLETDFDRDRKGRYINGGWYAFYRPSQCSEPVKAVFALSSVVQNKESEIDSTRWIIVNVELSAGNGTAASNKGRLWFENYPDYFAPRILYAVVPREFGAIFRRDEKEFSAKDPVNKKQSEWQIHITATNIFSREKSAPWTDILSPLHPKAKVPADDAPALGIAA